jgi:hypothetical protein
MSDKKLRKVVRNESNDIFDVMTKMGVEKRKVAEVRVQNAAIESAKKSLLNTKITRKEVRDMEYLAPIFEKLKKGTLKTQEDELDNAKEALKEDAHEEEKQERGPIKTSKPSPLARRVELVMRATEQINPEEMHDIEDLLTENGLSIDKPRRLEIECNYREVHFKGAMKKQNLQSFLRTHPGHHLAIFSVDRKRVKYCFYVPDLITLFASALNDDVSRPELEKMSWAEWDDLRIGSNEVTFTGREVVAAIALDGAYARLLQLLKKTTDFQQLRILKRLGDSFAPSKKEGTWRRVWNRSKRTARRKLENIMGLLALKMIVDIGSAFACVIALCVGFSTFGAVKFKDIWIDAMYTFIVGNIGAHVFAAFKGFMWTNDGILNRVVALVARPFRFLGIPFLPEIIEFVGGLFLSVGGYTLAIAGTSMICGALFFGASTILTGGATVATVGAAMVSGPTSFFMVNGTFIGMGLLFAFTAELKARSLGVLMGLFDPRVSGLTPLLQILAKDKACDFVGAILGVGAKRVCKEWGSAVMENILKLSIVFSIFDLAVFMLKASGMNIPYTTRCEAMFKSQLIPIVPKPVGHVAKAATTSVLGPQQTVKIKGFETPGQQTQEVFTDAETFAQLQTNAQNPAYKRNVEAAVFHACETPGFKGFASEALCRESVTKTLIENSGAVLGGGARSLFWPFM